MQFGRRKRPGLHRLLPALFFALAGCGSGGAPLGTASGVCAHIDYAAGVDLTDRSGIAFHQYGPTLSGGMDVALGATKAFTVTFLDDFGKPIVIANDCEIMQLVIEIADETTVAQLPVEGRRFAFALAGLAAGTTSLRVSLWHGTHRHFLSDAVPVRIAP